MPIGLPDIDVIFKQKAVSALQRSTRGIACVIIKDDTDDSFNVKQYRSSTELTSDKDKYTEDNYNALNDVYLGNPSKVIVAKVGAVETVANALSRLVNKSFNWMGIISSEASDHQTVVAWVKEQNRVRTKKIKAVTYKATTTDDKHIVNLINSKVKRTNDNSEIDGYLFLGRLVGIFAGLSMDVSATYMKLTDLEYVSDVENVEQEIGKGNLVLINDEEEVRIARAVNTLTTLTEVETEDMQYIVIVEAMDLIYEDIKTTFKENYIRKYKNKYDNQVLFISSVNSYFKGLARENILDPNYSNMAYINIEAQREAWLSIGKTEAEAWDDAAVRKNTFRTNVFLAGDIKILNAMEDLSFGINMVA